MKYNRRIWALAGCSMAVFLLVCIGWNHTDGNTAVHKAGEIKDISLHEPMERDGKIYLGWRITRGRDIRHRLPVIILPILWKSGAKEGLRYLHFILPD